MKPKSLHSPFLLLLLLAGSAQAALVSRAGGLAYYDTVLDITWLTNANAGAGSIYDDGPNTTDGLMTWASAQAWIASLNSANHLGVNTWQLPEVNPLNGISFNYPVSFNGSTDRGYNQSEQGTAFAGATGSMMAHLFYNTLDNKGLCDPLLSTASTCSGPQPGWGLLNTGPFLNLQNGSYWSGTTYAPDPTLAWNFQFSNGYQYDVEKTRFRYAWAVSPGDTVIPVPAAVWLFMSALGVVGLLRRRMLKLA